MASSVLKDCSIVFCIFVSSWALTQTFCCVCKSVDCCSVRSWTSSSIGRVLLGCRGYGQKSMTHLASRKSRYGRNGGDLLPLPLLLNDHCLLVDRLTVLLIRLITHGDLLLPLQDLHCLPIPLLVTGGLGISNVSSHHRFAVIHLHRTSVLPRLFPITALSSFRWIAHNHC